MSTATTSRRSIISRTFARHDAGSEASEDIKGPFGLNTLCDVGPAAIADLVFVHGLGGGSRSTWTQSGDPALYWPKEWLPHDPDFRNVRIHSFGYNSNWGNESTLGVHDFAKSLLASLHHCPMIPHHVNVRYTASMIERNDPRLTNFPQTPLVVVGHSMGGLVIKRAYIMACQKEEFRSVAQRFHTIVFLATPHRGADLAQSLSRVLNLSPGARPFVRDLHRNSLATQSINDEFPQYSQGLQLLSFYETLPMVHGLGKTLVVEKDAAVLGYANESATYLNANHREICKYTSTDDSNYRVVRNALASTLIGLREIAFKTRDERDNEQRRLLNNILGVTNTSKDYFLDVNNMRITGSCEWLMSKNSFREWCDSANTNLYWVSAKPATGKTVLSGKVIQHLTSSDRDVAFYFFDYRSKAQTSISGCLLSMVAQMAHMQTEILEAVLEICEEDDQLCSADYRTIWRKLFVEGILRVKRLRPHYWVIDALDECSNHTELVPLLCKVTESQSVRILVTSRTQYDSYRPSLHLKAQIMSEEISLEDTKSDIALYLEANLQQLPAIDEGARQEMVDVILAKSAGCFLWVNLIMQELRQAHTPTEIRQVLKEVPSDMNDLYSRILHQMSKAPSYSKRLAKSILTWTVCAARPLTTYELGHALQMDIQDKLDNVEASIESRCGQLVYVDAQSRVQMIHQTARDYLLYASGDSEFGVNRKRGHGRLLKTCLEYLNGNEMKGSRHRRGSATNSMMDLGPFASYACNSFFEHIFQVASQDDHTMISLAKFLGCWNVLAWLEYLALASNLNHMIRTAKALRNFLHRRSKYLSPFGKDSNLLETWATDLVRLVTKFGKNMVDSPFAIYNLIPPFCPPETALRKYFVTPNRGLSVVGLSSASWDDCLATIVDPLEHLSALASSDRFFAVGTSGGKITVYTEATCQEAQMLQHQESVTLLDFGRGTDFLVSAGSRLIRLWDTCSWQLIWDSKIPQQCMSIAFIAEDQLLLGALRNNHLTIWDLASGTVRDMVKWTEDFGGSASRRPLTAAFCLESYLLAVVYRGKDILLWSLESNALYDTYNRQGSSSRSQTHGHDAGVLCLVFNSAPTTSLLAAGYSDGDLLLYDTSEGVVIETALVNAQTLACSPDGRTLASGDSSGTIQLFDFETLKPLYRINSDDYCIRQLAFSGDSHRLMDIRRSECRVWDPTVLVRQDGDDSNSDTVSISSGAQEVSLQSARNVVLITALACDKEASFFFCGKEDGSIYLYETISGQQTRKLFSHAKGVTILSLLFNYETQTLVSLDITSRVMMHKSKHGQDRWEATEELFDHHTGAAVKQILTNPESNRLLISTTSSDTLWSVPADSDRPVATAPWEDRGSYIWGTHPANRDQLILVSDNVAHLYDWRTLERLTDAEGILLQGSILPDLAVQSITPCFNNNVVAIAFSESLRPHAKLKLLLWDASDFAAYSKAAAPIPQYHTLADQVRSVIGSDGTRLVFLDSQGWVASAEARATKTDEYNRHFFIPADWLTTNVTMMTAVTCHGDIIFVIRDEVAVIKRGLENTEQGMGEGSNGSRKRPSLIGRVRSSQRTSEKLTIDKTSPWSPILD